MKKTKVLLICVTIIILIPLSSCDKNPAASQAMAEPSAGFQGGDNYQPLDKGLYGNYYEIFVGSYYDSDGDGMGDLNGIVQKLDYLNDGQPESNTSLHIDGIWLMPIMPSPSYHKYDVTDYYGIDPAYGSMADFENLVRECGKRGIRLIIDLVMNHSSSEHPWFVKAREEISSGADWRYANYYNIGHGQAGDRTHSLEMDDYYYEGVFVDSMPDLNYDNEEVRREFENIAKFWLDKGVSGFRLDAVKWLYPDQQKSVDCLKWFVDYCKSIKPDIYMVGEVWSEDAEIMKFYESGIPSLFNFTFSDENGYPAKAADSGTGAYYANRLQRWDTIMAGRFPDAIDAVFLSNHDQDRSAHYLSEDPQKEKMAAALYLLEPGNPFIYYGEEIGMTGRGRDENKRGPMIWSLSQPGGLTDGPPARDSGYGASRSIEQQLADPDSLLRFYIRAIRLRNQFPGLWRGRVEEISQPDDALAVFKSVDGENILIVAHNVSTEEKTVILEKGKKSLGGFLTAAGGEVILKGNKLTLPGRSSALVVLG
ncbi:MAG: hypothetical protein LBC56_05200 [Oscillospiraceae bacterium]|jgi:glycosidase|nr:hypothetical protein [Oscillospiraceae bacterium]